MLNVDNPNVAVSRQTETETQASLESKLNKIKFTSGI